MLRVEWEQQGRPGDFALLAESAEARRTVMDLFPGALVTGVHRVKLREALRKL